MNDKFPNEMMEQFASMMKAAMPTVKPNKNGYEIRTKVLEFAQNQTWQDYHAKWGMYETHIHREGDELVTTVDLPTVPGADEVLKTAQKFYDFVNGNFNKTKD